MLFNSFQFAILLVVVFALYWIVKRRDARNAIILTASYVFYGFWDWRFIFLIIFSSFVDFYVGKLLIKQKKEFHKKILLGISLIANLGVLGFFKYFNFFIDSFVQITTELGFHFNRTSLNIILPVGISFYTFQTLSYTIDIYRGRIKPTNNILSFFTFVAFFPQLVAGPIERASKLLPQFQKAATFDRNLAAEGLKQMLWGFFKKMVIADNAAIIVNEIFGDYANASPTALMLGIFLFAFQIYADFSGYSDIAIGVAKLFGIRLMTNFKMPYFASSISEFWRRWHISLSTWFRDYVFIPLGGSRNGIYRQIVALFATFLLSGLWHGANLTFLVWGFLHAILYIIELFFKKIFLREYNFPVYFQKLLKLSHTVIVLFSIMMAWLFFRVEKISDAFLYLNGIIKANKTSSIYFSTLQKQEPFIVAMVFVFLLLVTEWFTRNELFPIQNLKQKPIVRYAIYMFFILIIFLFTPGQKTDFIYFQF